MAIMIDARPELRGEAKTWESVKQNFPEKVICYNNREIKGREYDMCMLFEDRGIVIIEVKGWVYGKFEVHGIDDIAVEGYDEPQGSPKKQARVYRFTLLNDIRKRYGANPLILDLVCYPFISKAEYLLSRLDIISDDAATIFKEDLENHDLLIEKIDQAFRRNQAIPHDPLSNLLMERIRRDWEPDYREMPDTVAPGFVAPYSVLSTHANPVSSAIINKITNSFFNGVREIVFVGSLEDQASIAAAIDKRLQEKGIQLSQNGLSVGYKTPVPIENGIYRAFNLEIYFVPYLSSKCPKDIEVIEGVCTQEEKEYLSSISECTEFNLQQYWVEHASTEKNTLVEAGAGTGKTYSMVSRIAYLCNKRINPVRSLSEEIALMTFTNDAATNMRVRLKRLFTNYFILTGEPRYLALLEEVDRAHISTIHKFVIEQLRKEVLYSNLGTNFRIAGNEFERGKKYEELLCDYLERKEKEQPGFAYEIPLPVFELKKKLIGLADRLLAKSIDLGSIGAAELGMPNGGYLPFFNELIMDVLIPAEQLYSAGMDEANELDLKESIVRYSRVLEAHDGKIRGLGFRFFFIDEFQDTDDIQISVFCALQKMVDADCMLFIVGDLKQSIYRFRGATLSAFDQAMAQAKNEWERFNLTKNYRTDESLLDCFHDVFRNMGQKRFLPYSDEDRLTSNLEIDNPDERFKCIFCNCRDDEEFVAAIIGELKNQIANLERIVDQRRGRGETPLSKEERTIAILVRSNFEVGRIVDLGKSNGIKIDTNSGGDLFQLESTIDMYKLLIALSNSDDPVNMVNLIESNFIKLDLDYQKYRGASVDETREGLVRILDDFFKARMDTTWREMVSSALMEPILFTIKRIYDSLRPWKSFSKNLAEQRQYKANYEVLVERLLQGIRVDTMTLSQIAEYLRINIVTRQEQPSRTLEVDQGDIRVLCTTVHKSKGLEYGTVFLPFTATEIGNVRKVRLEANLIDGKLAYFVEFHNRSTEYNTHFDMTQELTEQIEEESRILYVALTRAIRNFVWIKDIRSRASNSWGKLLEA